MKLPVFTATVALLMLAAAACGDPYDDGDRVATPTPQCRADACDTPRPEPTIAASATAGTPAQTATALPPTATPELPPSPPAPGAGTLQGYVHIGPTCPVVREGEGCDDRPYEAELDVFDGAKLLMTLRSDASGNFSASLAAGDYLLVPRNDGRLPYANEQAFVIEAGRTTKLDVAYDSGIR